MYSSNGAIAQMQEKVQGWVAKAKESKLHKGHLNFLLDKQFWPRVSFFISSVCAPFEELEECLMRIYYDMLPLCGTVCLTSIHLLQIGGNFTETSGGLTNLFHGCVD